MSGIFGGVPQVRAGLSVNIGIGGAVPVANWWEAGGTVGCVAAYMAKGAASFATSKINLANPGTYNAGDGASAPIWTLANGWEFDGITNYLTTGIVPTGIYTALIQINTIAASQQNIFGITDAGSFFRVYADFFDTCYIGNGNQTGFNPGFSTPGNIGFAGLNAIRNGISIGVISGSGHTPGTKTIYIGGINADGAFVGGATFKCSAFAVFDNTLTAGQYLAVSMAMAAL